MRTPKHLNPTQEKAIISLSANSGMAICKALEIACNNNEQIERIYLETHICGASMMRFFLAHSGKATKDDPAITQIENSYFVDMLKSKEVVRNRAANDYARSRYLQNVTGISSCSAHA